MILKKKKPHIAISMQRNSLGWVMVRYEIQDGKITKTVTSEPNLRSITSDQLLRDINIFYEESTYD